MIWLGAAVTICETAAGRLTVVDAVEAAGVAAFAAAAAAAAVAPPAAFSCTDCMCLLRTDFWVQEYSHLSHL